MTKTKTFLQKLKPDWLTLLLIGLLVYFWFRPPAWVSARDEPAPAVTIQTEAGPRALADWRGQVVLVNFWATWCPYCRHEMPDMERFYRDYRSQGFDILALSLDETQAEVDGFMREEGYTFPAYLSAGASHGFGDVSRLPTSFIIDRQGVIRHKITGQVHYARLEKYILPLLKEQP